MVKKLTEQQQKFLMALKENIEMGVEAKQALKFARKEAGYSDNTRPSEILQQIGDAAIELIDSELKVATMEAFMAIKDVLANPNERGAAVKLNAATAIFDRAGLSKRERQEVTVNAPLGIAILPAKKPLDPEDEQN